MNFTILNCIRLSINSMIVRSFHSKTLPGYRIKEQFVSSCIIQLPPNHTVLQLIVNLPKMITLRCKMLNAMIIRFDSIPRLAWVTLGLSRYLAGCTFSSSPFSIIIMSLKSSRLLLLFLKTDPIIAIYKCFAQWTITNRYGIALHCIESLPVRFCWWGRRSGRKNKYHASSSSSSSSMMMMIIICRTSGWKVIYIGLPFVYSCSCS